MTEEIKKKIREHKLGTILVILDGAEHQYNCISYKDLQEMLKIKCQLIITPLTTAIDNELCLRGYKVIVRSENKEYCLNDLLLGINTNPNEKELRISHNAEKLFLSGAYDIKVLW